MLVDVSAEMAVAVSGLGIGTDIGLILVDVSAEMAVAVSGLGIGSDIGLNVSCYTG